MMPWEVFDRRAPRPGSLASIKARMRAGTRLLCVEDTLYPELAGKVRIVDRVQQQAIVWREEGTSKRAWLYWGACPAKHVTMLDADTFKLDLTDGPSGPVEGHVTLRFQERP